MPVVVKCDWGLKYLRRSKEVPYGSQYLYADVPKDGVGKYWWGDDLASARNFNTLEEAQEFVAIVWPSSKIIQPFEFLDSETKEVIATDARADTAEDRAGTGQPDQDQ